MGVIWSFRDPILTSTSEFLIPSTVLALDPDSYLVPDKRGTRNSKILETPQE